MKNYHKNPRQITREQFKSLGKWLEQLGDLGGIVHNIPTDELIGGNQRARVFDINKCEVVIEHDFDKPDEQGTIGLGYVIWQGNRYAYRRVDWDEKTCEQANIVANKAGGTWDVDILANEWELPDLLEWGFDESELQLDWGNDETPDPGAQVDKAAELLEKWHVERGQIWQVGRHRVMCGDSTDEGDVGRLMDGERAALCMADPPYGIGASGMTMGKAQSSKPKEARLSHGQEWDNVRVDVLPLLDVSRWACIWGGNYFSDTLPVTNDWLCWHKKNDDRSFSEFELAWTNYGKQSRHLDHHWDEEKDHITQKPLAVIKWAIDKCPDEKGAVYDPFIGSGTTLVACEQTGRIGYGMEISEKYVSVTLERLTGLGLEAHLVDG